MSTHKDIVFLAGDGIGPEISIQALKLLKHFASIYDISYKITELPIGGACYDIHQVPITDQILDRCKKADAVFLGAVGGDKWDNLPMKFRPESALLKLRKGLGLYANLRPIEIYDGLDSISPLKASITKGVDLMIVRELTGGIYFGNPRGIKEVNGQKTGFNTMQYCEDEIKIIAKKAFELSLQRSGRLCSVDKANVLETSRLWRETVDEVAKSFPSVKLSHMYVDNAAMQLISNPRQFDCILTGNMFGDILSDLAATITGSIGLLPSVSIGGKTILYEPVHGSAPDIAGKNLANPLAAFSCIGLMLKHTFKIDKADVLLNKALTSTLEKYRTSDIWQDGTTKLGCSQMGDIFIKNISNFT
ncbi:MAG: 3-isopropylmalate dehydrogenase [SAR324 cluster bacterium]|nr:3-isopropylmalate dehydrogenase [SAR324 cluster bacterium]